MIRPARLALVALWLVLCLPSFLGAQDAREFNRLGLNALRAGNFAEARDQLRKAMQLQPTWAEPYFNAHQLLKLVKKPADSRRMLIKAYELEPANKAYREAYAVMLKDDLRVAREARNEAECKTLRRKVLEVDPEQLEIALDIAKELAKAGNNAELKKFILDLLDKNKAELSQYRSGCLGDLLFYLAKIEFGEQSLRAARDHCQKAIGYPLEAVEEAKALLEEIKTGIKNEIDGLVRNGKTLLEQGNFADATAAFDKALALDPDNEEIQAAKDKGLNSQQAKDLFAEGKKLVEAGRWLQARDYLEPVVEAQPNNTEAKTMLKKAVAVETELMTKLGRAEKLPRSSGELVALAEGFISQGQRFMSAGNHRDAKIAYDRALAIIAIDESLTQLRKPIDADLAKISNTSKEKETWEKAVELYKGQDWEEAVKLLESLNQDYDIQLQSYLAFCYWKKGEPDKAKEMANKSLAKQPENNRSKFVLANVYHQEGDNNAAYQKLMEIKNSDPEYPGLDDMMYKIGSFAWAPVVIPVVIILVLLWIAYIIYNNLPEYNKNAAIKRGRSYLGKGMYRECIDELNKVKRLPILTPYDGALISRLQAQAFLKTAAYDKAVGECKHLLSINPQDAEAHQWLGFAYLGRRMVSPESLPELLNLYKTEKNNSALIGLLGQHYAAQKTLAPEGVELLERWLDTEPNNPDLLKTLGKHYLQKGKSDPRAMKVFEAMMTTTKPEPEFLLGIAKMQLRLKNYDASLKSCEQVLTMDVNNEMVHPVLRETYMQMGQLPQLVDIYRSYLAENPYNVAFQKGLTEANKLLARQEKVGDTPAPNSNLPGGVSRAPVAAPEVPALPDAPAEGDGAGEGICQHCGKQNQKTDYYCQHCGQKLL